MRKWGHTERISSLREAPVRAAQVESGLLPREPSKCYSWVYGAPSCFCLQGWTRVPGALRCETCRYHPKPLHGHAGSWVSIFTLTSHNTTPDVTTEIEANRHNELQFSPLSLQLYDSDPSCIPSFFLTSSHCMLFPSCWEPALPTQGFSSSVSSLSHSKTSSLDLRRRAHPNNSQSCDSCLPQHPIPPPNVAFGCFSFFSCTLCFVNHSCFSRLLPSSGRHCTMKWPSWRLPVRSSWPIPIPLSLVQPLWHFALLPTLEMQSSPGVSMEWLFQMSFHLLDNTVPAASSHSSYPKVSS